MSLGTGRPPGSPLQWGDSEFCTGRGWYPGMILTPYPSAVGKDNWIHTPMCCLNTNGVGTNATPVPDRTSPSPKTRQEGPCGKSQRGTEKGGGRQQLVSRQRGRLRRVVETRCPELRLCPGITRTTHPTQRPHLPSAARSCQWLRLGEKPLPSPRPAPAAGGHSLVSTSYLG